MYRYKTVVGRRLQARTLPNQRTEAKVGGNVLNLMTSLGMPTSVRVRGSSKTRGRRGRRRLYAPTPDKTQQRREQPDDRVGDRRRRYDRNRCALRCGRRSVNHNGWRIKRCSRFL